MSDLAGTDHEPFNHGPPERPLRFQLLASRSEGGGNETHSQFVALGDLLAQQLVLNELVGWSERPHGLPAEQEHVDAVLLNPDYQATILDLLGRGAHLKRLAAICRVWRAAVAALGAARDRPRTLFMGAHLDFESACLLFVRE